MTKLLQKSAIRIAVIEDDNALRKQVGAWLNLDKQFDCIGDYSSTELALADLDECNPDIWLVDINLPGQNGIEFVRCLLERFGEPKALMLTAYDDSELIFEALKAGASGYLLKRHAATQLHDAIIHLHQGGAPMSPEIACQVVAFFREKGQRQRDIDSISPREREILDLLSKGLAYKEIAYRLDISLDTVRTHLKRLYGKLHVHSRTEAVVKYLGE